MHGVADRNEPMCIEANLFIMTGAHFAEAREVYSELVQQSAQRHYDQDLGVAREKPGKADLGFKGDPLHGH